MFPTVIPRIALTEDSASGDTESLIKILRKVTSSRFAIDDDLAAVGYNVGIPRAPGLTDNTIYRNVIQCLSWTSVGTKRVLMRLLEVIFGTRTALIEAGDRPWEVFEFTNEIVIELPMSLIQTSNDNASYLHGASGYALNATGSTSSTFTAPGNLQASSATTLVGMTIDLYLSGAWDSSRTISAISYSASTDITTVTVSGAAIIPTGGCPFFIGIDGDGVESYRGDYLARGRQVLPYKTPTGGGTTNTINLYDDQTQFFEDDGRISVFYNGAFHEHTLTAAPTYTVSTNITELTVTPALPQSLSSILLVLLEKADSVTPATASHVDRVYLAGYGLYDVFRFYYDLLARGAGIILRLELVLGYTYDH